MAAELIPIRLGITAGDLYTLWAPRWRDSGDEWEGFLGKDENVFAFASVADLAAFVRTDSDNDLAEHPAWEAMTRANAHRLEPAEDRQADLIAVAEQLAEKPTEDSVGALANTLAVVSSLGSVCELPAVTRFFNGNPNLGLVTGGLEQFTGRAGRKRWDTVGEIVARGWDGVLSAIDEIVITPEVDEGVAAAAADELAEPFDGEDDFSVLTAETDDDENEDDGGAIAGIGALSTTSLGSTSLGASKTVVLGGDAHFWENVGIDPVRVMTSGGTFFTLRCYYEDRPRFLGRNGRISVFGSERALARYLADEHDHDLADLSTYDDIRTAATDGSLRVDVIEDNVYVLNGLADDIADGPDAIDRDQLALAVEFVRDVGSYSEDDAVDVLLAEDTTLGAVVNHVLDPDSVARPAPPYATAARQWEELEGFVESRLRRE
ncbi:MAG TPA: primosomal protein [Mycobacterium sp.]|nr:primosomal protein [Mycobacterium sp.]